MSKKIDEAIKFAVDAHSGQRRKLSGEPYVLHPLEVAAIVGHMTTDEDVICAALLHDVVEDAGLTLIKIQALFGERVAELVASETENKRPEMSAEDSWQIRKEESIAALRESKDIGVKMVWLGDKLSNARSVFREWKRRGDLVWQGFHQKDKSKHEWYYRSVAEAVEPYLGETAAYMEFTAILDMIF